MLPVVSLLPHDASDDDDGEGDDEDDDHDDPSAVVVPPVGEVIVSLPRFSKSFIQRLTSFRGLARHSPRRNSERAWV